MVGRSKNKTKDDERRFQLLQEVGCLPCRMIGLGHQYGDVHHILRAGRRQSHQHTIVLCKFHHVGSEPGYSDKFCREHKGPSLAKEKREFYNQFGSEEELLETTNEALRVVEESFV